MLNSLPDRTSVRKFAGSLLKTITLLWSFWVRLNPQYFPVCSLRWNKKLESTKAVPLTISAITPFPFSRPRIAAALVEHSAELLQLQSDVANCVRKCGITTERRRFVPHVTLGRLKPRAGKTVDFKVRNILLSGIADSVTLFQSELTPDRAIHTALAEVPWRTLPEQK